MFRSEELVRITIQVPEQFISAVTGVLARFRLLHLIRIDETHLGRMGYVAETDGDLVEEYDGLLKETEALLDSLQVVPDGMISVEGVIPEKEVFRVREQVREIHEEIDTALGALIAVERSIGEKSALAARFRLLPGDLDLTRLSRCGFVNWIIGLVPAHGLEKLEESLSQIHHALVELSTVGEQTVILVFGLRKDWAVFERALTGALIDRIAIPPGITGTVSDTVMRLDAEIAELGEKRQIHVGKRDHYRERFDRMLLLIKERITAARQILAARRFFGKIDKSYLISGWMPVRHFDALGDELGKVTGGQVVFEKVEPEELRQVRGGIVSIPILFNNPMLISPFERLTSLYGTPRYREVEPTVFFALSFLLLFGMMFGDAGQGVVLFVLGYYIFRRFYKYVDYGIILMECGFSSAVFGILYGSVFGLESVIPALWFRPMDNIAYFVKVALSLGMILVSLGLVLNLINAVRLKEYEGLLGAGGLAGALLYWMAAGLGMKYLLTGQVAPWEISLLGWVTAVLVAIMILHRPLMRLAVKREPIGSVLGHAGLTAELMESIVEVFDDILRFIANTVSFIRVAAFALSHTALFIAVFSIADIVSHKKGGGISYWSVVAVGNVAIILLEGLVVAIQTVRLEYYEFFGKFFRGGGERFKPFDFDREKHEK